MFYRESYLPLMEDYDKKWRLTAMAAIKLMENTGNRHGDSVGDGAVDCLKKGFTSWIIADWNVKFISKPVYGEQLTVKSWIHSKYLASNVTRLYEIYDSKENLCVVGSSKLVLFDGEAKRIVRINKELFDSYRPEDKRIPEVSDLGKLTAEESHGEKSSYVLRRSDFDFNRHLHNLSYLQLAMESIPYVDYENNDFSLIRIAFLKPMLAKDTADVTCSKINGGYSVALYDFEHSLCALVELSSNFA